MTTADIIVSPGTIYYAPVGEAIPDRDSIAYGDAWGGNWVNPGYTMAPFTMNRDASTFQVMVEQSTLPAKRTVTEEIVTFETTLAELTAVNLELGMNGTAQSVAAGSGTVGYEELDAGGEFQLDERAWGVEGLYIDASNNQFPIRLFIWRATATLNGQLQFAKAAAAGIPLQIQTLGDLTQAVGSQLFKMEKVTAAALP